MAKKASPIAERFTSDGFEVIHLKFTRSSQLADFIRCLRAFRKLKPELVGSHSNIDTRVALAAAAVTRVSRRVRYRHVSIPVRVSPWNKIIYRHLATRIVTTAESISHELKQNFTLPGNSTATIPTGVRESDGTSREQARRFVKQRFGIPENARLITQVSVLRGWKGHVHLIDAFSQLAAADPSLHLVLAGGGNMLEALQEKIKDLPCGDRIHFAGHVEDPYPYFQSADVVTLASTGGEGVPQSALQCFACAVPFVGTTVGGIPDIVRHEENGLLVSPGDPVGLAAAIDRILKNPALAEALATEARRTFETTGSIGIMGKRLRDFLCL